MVGTRGLPASVGGIERHVEELGARLVDRGHHVTVFSRRAYGDGSSSYRGMRVVQLPTIPTKHLEATVHSALASSATMGWGYDIAHFHALGPGLFSFLPRLVSKAQVVQTIHGLDDQRNKWSGGARTALQLARLASTRVPHQVIGVSEELVRVYREEHGRKAVYIPNGHPEYRPIPPGPNLERLGLTPGQYVMFLGRLVPEKDPAALIRAFAQVPTTHRLVVVGDSSHSDKYTAMLHEMAAADDRVTMAGTLVGDDLWEVLTSAAIVVQPSLLEGLPLTLLEAATYGRRVVVSDIPAHQEIVRTPGPGQRMFRAGQIDELARALRDELAAGAQGEVGAAALRESVLERYDWDQATQSLEELYIQTLDRRRRPADVSVTAN